MRARPLTHTPRCAGYLLVASPPEHPYRHDYNGRQRIHAARQSCTLLPGMRAICSLHGHEGLRIQACARSIRLVNDVHCFIYMHVCTFTLCYVSVPVRMYYAWHEPRRRS
jgi:hypothetical protein